MRLIVRQPRTAGEVDLPLVFAVVLLAAGGLATVVLGLGLTPPACPLKTATGIPCISCGGTRMARALLAGDPLAAFSWNPVLFLLGLGTLASGGVCAVRRLLGKPRLRLVADRGWERAALRVGALATLALGWIYLWWAGV